MVDLSIIIVSYNTEEFLRNCLQSLKHNVSEKISFEVIVVDNDSKDGSWEMVKKEFPHFNLIENKENLGFSKANNIGVKKSKGKYILFLNSDTIVHPNTLETILEFMETHKKAGASTCKLELPNGQIDDASHRGFPTPFRAFCHFSGISKLFPHSLFFNGYNLGWKDLDKIHEIDALAGAFMIVRKEGGEEVGWWDEDYFFYGEDLDFCYKLKEKGWKIYYVPQVSILHYKGVSGGIKDYSQHLTKADEQTRQRATHERFKAMRIFYKKHYAKKYPGFITWIILAGISFKEKMS